MKIMKQEMTWVTFLFGLLIANFQCTNFQAHYSILINQFSFLTFEVRRGFALFG